MRRSHNQQNINTSTTRSKSGIKGVRWDGRRGKWTARINVYGKEVFLGYYEEKEDAQIAAISGRIIYHPLSKEKRIYDELMNSKRQFD